MRNIAVIRLIILITACLILILNADGAVAAAAGVAAQMGGAEAATSGGLEQSVRRVYSGRDYIITETEVVGDYSAADQRYPSVDSRFYDGLAIIRGRDGYGYIDRTGHIVIPAVYVRAHAFRDGIARVVETDRSARGRVQNIMYVDTSGNTATNLETIRKYNSFHAYITLLIHNVNLADGAVYRDGLALAREGADGSGAAAGSAGAATSVLSWNNGRSAAPSAAAPSTAAVATVSTATTTKEAIATAAIAADDNFGAISKYQPSRDTQSGGQNNSQQPASSADNDNGEDDSAEGGANADANTDSNTDSVTEAETGAGRFGYIDEDGNVVVPFQYDYGCTSFNEGLALARKGDKLYVLEKLPADSIPVDSPEVAGKRIPILMYHAVHDNPHTSNSGLFVRPSEMEAHLKYLADNGFQTITFEDLDNIGAYDKPVMLTYDDGYKDNYTILLPLLKKYDMKATVFIITDAVVWGNDEFVSTDEIIEMSNSGHISIQSHTVTHPQLPDVSGARVARELSESKTFLEELIGKPVDVLCYPVGKNNASVRTQVADYYKYAVVMGGGKFRCGDNLLAMSRIYVARGTSAAAFAQLVN